MEGPEDDDDWHPTDFILALELKMPVSEMLQRLPNPEYWGWMAFFEWRKAQQDIADT